jgi:uncharacterized membrane protein
MENLEPVSPPAKSKLPAVVIVILVLLAACIVIPICVIVILALLGPAIGNVFSNIVLNV